MFIDLIRNRRSVRRFKKQAVEPDKIDLLIEAALRSPSSRSLNPWEFIVVTDPAMLTDLSTAKPHGATFLKNAPLGIVVIADPEKCDVWIEDCSIAAIFIQLAAQSMDLGSCWIQIRKRMHKDGGTAEAFVREKLNIPDRYCVLSIVAVGYPEERPKGHPKSSLSHDKVSTGTYKADG